MDYRAWVEDFRSFHNSLRHLPGKVTVDMQIAPALTNNEADVVAAKWPGGLPRSLRDFWTQGTSGIECRTVWEMPTDLHRRLGEIFYCGERFNSHVQLMSAEEVFPDNVGFSSEPEVYEPAGPDWFGFWTGSAMFIACGDGDAIGIDARPVAPEPPIVFLDHDGDEEAPCGYMEKSLDEFLTKWKDLCFVGLNRWRVEPWWDRDRQVIDIDRPQTAEIQDIFTSRR